MPPRSICDAMKFLLPLFVLAFAMPEAPASAATFSLRRYPQNTIAVYLRGESTVFNGIDFRATPDGGAQFQSLSGGLVGGAPRPAGFAATYRNRALDLAPDDIDFPGIGKGWTLISPTINANQVSFAGGPGGLSIINTAIEPNGELFLANLKLPSRGIPDISATLVNGSNTVAVLEVNLATPVMDFTPEPASSVLIFVGIVAMAHLRRVGRRT